MILNLVNAFARLWIDWWPMAALVLLIAAFFWLFVLGHSA